jgi:hypothetical protein
MKFLHPILSILTFFALCVAGVDFENADVRKSSYEYQVRSTHRLLQEDLNCS